MGAILRKLDRITAVENVKNKPPSLSSFNKSSSPDQVNNKGVQTDFPVSLLGWYFCNLWFPLFPSKQQEISQDPCLFLYHSSIKYSVRVSTKKLYSYKIWKFLWHLVTCWLILGGMKIKTILIYQTTWPVYFSRETNIHWNIIFRILCCSEQISYSDPVEYSWSSKIWPAWQCSCQWK